MMSTRKSLLIAWIALSASLRPLSARAGGQEEATAETLFQEAKALMAQGKFAEACPKLAESQELDPAVGTLLYLGECYDQNGQTASAWATFSSAADAAQRAGQSDRARTARERANEIAKKLSKLTINVDPAARTAGLQIKRDGVRVGDATWGIAVAVDPGEHAIEASAPGKKPWVRNVKVEPGSGQTSVAVPPLEAESGTLAEPSRAPTPPPATSTPPVDAGSATGRGKTQRVIGLAVGGLGVAGLAVGTGFGLRAKSKQKQADKYCQGSDPPQCSQPGVDLLHEGHSSATLANVGFAVGGVALVGGVVLYLTAPSASVPRTASIARRLLTVTPEVGPQSSRVTITGSF
jgi:serine/threonine-protein kinase